MNNQMSLKLGDIIKFISPTNEKFHNNEYIITYIDNNYFEILNETQKERINLENGTVADKSIKQIIILEHAEKKGFVNQNNLIVGQWINIHFNGDLPIILTGEIMSHDEDMIEIKTHPEKKYIYIDFEYSGIKPEFNIEKIELRDKPIITDNNYGVIRDDEIELDNRQNKNEEPNNNEAKDENIEPKDEDNDGEEEVNEEEVDENVDKNLSYASENIENNNIEFQEELENNELGNDLGFIEVAEKVDESEKRYGIQLQIEDLANDILSNIKVKERTPKVKKNVEKIIFNFIKMREIFSNMNENGNIENINYLSNEKPLHHNILNNKPPSWLYYGASFKRKIYQEDDNIEFVNSNILEDIENYKNDSSNYLLTNEKKFLTSMNKTLNPIENNNLLDNNFTLYEIDHDLNAVCNNDNNLTTIGLKLKSNPNGKNINNYTHKFLKDDDIIFNSFVTLPKYFFNIQSILHNENNIITKINSNNLKKHMFKVFLEKAKNNKNINNFNLKDFNTLTHYTTKDFSDVNNLLKSFPNINEIILFNKSYFNYRDNHLSVKNFINKLDKFNIYSDNIDYDAYVSIKNIIYEQRREFFTHINKMRKTYNTLERSIDVLNTKEINKIFFNLLFSNRKASEEENKLLEGLLEETYLRKEENTSLLIENNNSSLINHLLNIDNQDFLTTVIAFGNVNLSNDNFETMMENYKSYLNNSLVNNNNKSNTDIREKCEIDINISKKYKKEEEIANDNETDIFYDEHYDNTYYDAINVYQDEKKTMTEVQFKEFLKNKLKEVYNLNDEDAELMTIDIILGKKKVREGDFAILETYDDELVDYSLYRRINNKWVFDEESTEKNKENYLLLSGDICKQTLDCSEIENDDTDGTCENTVEKRQKINKKIIDNMINEFKHVYAKKETELKLMVAEKANIYKKKMKLKLDKLYKYSEYSQRISDFYNFEELENKSPVIKMKESILAIENFTEKQEAIITFVTKFLRKPLINNKDEIENEYMLYCKETNQAILPLFIYKLADTFVSGGSYVKEIENIKATQGELSDDGSYWVDEYSGYKICNIDYSTDEGYDEKGFKINTKSEVLIDENSNDLEYQDEDLIFDEYISKIEYESDIKNNSLLKFKREEANFIYNTISKFENEINCIFDNKLELVTKALYFYDSNPNLKTNPDMAQLVICICVIVIGLQLNVNDLKLVGYHGSCKTYIKGYPLYDEKDLKTLIFVTCIIKNFKINKEFDDMDNSEIVKNLKSYIDRMLRTIFKSNINDFIQEQKKQIIQNQNVYNNEKMKSFLPFQTEIELPIYNSLSIKFENDMMNLDNVHIVKSKIISLGYHILNECNNIVSKEDLHYKLGNIFTENSCCFSKEINVNEYFKNKSKQYEMYIEHSTNLNNLLDNVRKNNKTKTFMSNINTRTEFPKLYYHQEEHLINEAVEIYRDNIIIDDDNENENNNKENINLNYIYEKNIIKTEEIKQFSYCDLYSQISEEELQKYNDEKFKEFLSKLKNITIDKDVKCNQHNNTVYKTLITKFENYLYEEINLFKDNIVAKIDVNINQKTKRKNKSNPKHVLFLNKLSKLFLLHSDKKLTNKIENINAINNILHLFKEKININRDNHKKFKVPKHWNLSKNDILTLNKYHTTNLTKYDSIKINEDFFYLINSDISMYISYINSFKMPLSLNYLDLNIKIYLLFFIINKLVDNLENIYDETIKYDCRIFVIDLLDMLNTKYDNFNVSYNDITKKTLRSKEKEKDDLTKKLKGKEEEELKVDNLLKKHKLGKWGRGLDKSLYVYDARVQDEERQQFIGLEMNENNDLSEYHGEEGEGENGNIED